MFIGFVGLNIPGYELPFSPVIEIGWRLDNAFWGKGYAPEAARKALEIGFQQFGMKEIVAFTALDNIPSQRVMEKIGMSAVRSLTILFWTKDIPYGDMLFTGLPT